MFDRKAESERLAAIVERDSRRLTRSMLEDLLSIARRWKPSTDYDRQACTIRRYYEGDSLDLVRAQLAKAFPKTYHKMLPVSLNITRHLAEQQASIYNDEPERSVFVGDSETPDEARTEALRDAFARGRARSVLPEAERRTMAVRSQAIRVGVDPADQRLIFQTFWPDDFAVVPHHTAPHSLGLAVAFIARVVGPGGNEESKWFEVWTRPIVDGPDGMAAQVGPWSVELCCEDGDRTSPFGSDSNAYEGARLPWVIFNDGIPQGSPFVPLAGDAVSVQEATNQLWSDQMFGRRMQAHPAMVYAGSSQKADLVGGPADIINIGDGETLSLLGFPSDDSLMDTAERMLRAHAVLNRISPDSASTDSAPSVQTGIARVIANLPQTEARRERLAYFRDAEEHHLMPIAAEVSDLWLGTNIGGDSVRYGVEFTEPENYEDPEARQRRVMELRAEKLISDARAAVELGLYETEEDAEAAGLSAQIGGPAQSAAPVFSLRSRLAAVAAVDEPEEEDEPEAA